MAPNCKNREEEERERRAREREKERERDQLWMWKEKRRDVVKRKRKHLFFFVPAQFFFLRIVWFFKYHISTQLLLFLAALTVMYIKGICRGLSQSCCSGVEFCIIIW
jgi:hypothetical protein